MALGLLTIHLHLPGCRSLKEKRRRIKPLLARLGREFNISVAEIDHLDEWQQAIIACAYVSNDRSTTQKALSGVLNWVERYWPDVSLISDETEIIL